MNSFTESHAKRKALVTGGWFSTTNTEIEIRSTAGTGKNIFNYNDRHRIMTPTVPIIALFSLFGKYLAQT
jgi:hypothetical protein